MNLSLPQDEAQKGVASAMLAFCLWGFLPLYWKMLEAVSSIEVVGQRICWSFVFMLCILLYTGGLGKSLMVFREPRKFLILCCSGVLLGGNWLLYIWAVNNDQVLATSLGYYINPLLNILAGRLFFGDKATRLTWIAISFALVGVMFQVVTAGELPLVALGLGGSFALYGLLRKIVVVEAIPGLFVETLAIFPFALGYIIWLETSGAGAWHHADIFLSLLFVCLGVVTTVPLLLFTYAARRVSLTAIGLMQYFSPSITFLLGVFVFHEPLYFANMVTFVCIWIALALYTWDSLRNHKKKEVRQ